MILELKSQFRPFTYDEMMKPLVAYKEEYDKVAQDYSNLIAQTEMWKDVANQTNSPEAFEMYNRYSNNLEAWSESFSKGMNINNRSALLGLKRDYYRDIDPISKAAAAMEKANAYRDELKAKDPSAIFKKDKYSSIDDFLHGKVADNSYVSGDKVLARTSARAEALSKSLFSNPNFTKILEDQKFMVMQANGCTPEELFRAVAQDPRANIYLSQLYREEWEANNGDSFGAEGQAQLKDAIVTGMHAALAKPVYNFIDNGNFIDAYKRQSLAIDRERLAISREAARHSGGRHSSNSSDSDDYSNLTPQQRIDAGIDPAGYDEASGQYIFNVKDGPSWKATRDNKGKYHKVPGSDTGTQQSTWKGSVAEPNTGKVG